VPVAQETAVVPPQDLIIVAAHAALSGELRDAPELVERDDAWVLEPYQAGEAPFYLEHMRHGAVLAARNPQALLVFSGGRTRRAAGTWSEAASYRRVAERAGWWLPAEPPELRAALGRRSTTEEFARDSCENLLFSLCRFQQLAGRYPGHVTVVSWAFKAERFELHRSDLRLPASRFRFVGHGEPCELDRAEQGEAAALRAFRLDPYGRGAELGDKRARRNPFSLEHPYRSCPGLGEFFRYLDGHVAAFAGTLPWED
jgi:hypothetical protein